MEDYTTGEIQESLQAFVEDFPKITQILLADYLELDCEETEVQNLEEMKGTISGYCFQYIKAKRLSK